MRSAQIIAVDIADAVDLCELLLAGREISVNPVDDLEEAQEIAGVVGAGLVFLSPAAAGDDPIGRLGEATAALGERPPPFAVIYPEAFQRTRIYVRAGGADEWVTLAPGGERLAPVLAALLDKGDGFVHFELPAAPGLKNRLIDIGLNTLVKSPAGDVSVQTETHVLGKKTVVRSIAFASGRIALSCRLPIGFVANPVEETRRLVEDVHHEMCGRAATLAPAAG
jgi:hypothetical protein